MTLVPSSHNSGHVPVKGNRAVYVYVYNGLPDGEELPDEALRHE